MIIYELDSIIILRDSIIILRDSSIILRDSIISTQHSALWHMLSTFQSLAAILTTLIARRLILDSFLLFGFDISTDISSSEPSSDPKVSIWVPSGHSSGPFHTAGLDYHTAGLDYHTAGLVALLLCITGIDFGRCHVRSSFAVPGKARAGMPPILLHWRAGTVQPGPE